MDQANYDQKIKKKKFIFIFGPLISCTYILLLVSINLLNYELKKENFFGVKKNFLESSNFFFFIL